MTETSSHDEPGFTAEEPECCSAGYRLIRPGQTYYLTIKNTMLEEFFRIAFRTRFYESAEQLQTDLAAYLVHSNMERPHQGCHKQGRPAIDTVNLYLKERSLVDAAAKRSVQDGA